ncbi:RdgB/HAM1 family non-canonical purine NTP pyrophosphatase [Youxingia wuxianensis]|uniref:dITP/XTP pyrophosphatase n=1 Tax=Youxingia wuxianensis TaxID=2763678 RepID=A0A926EL48_9FIRM|nr:RdgB/HAM1 family non-canonical purine NTP pyrophosphatase [Youxingia wuxianensis]MBC8584375.1 RdgB/HAM1 family non-canonical purine NTP pyrophosphatase [Youxingia wuxianensis]
MKVVAATGNKGKIREFTRIFAPFGIEVISQSQVCPELEVEENGTTFEENSFLKANAVHQHTKTAVVADDSGLCVDALGGAPGVYSARYAGEDTPYPEKIRLLLEELKDIPDEKRTARFVAHICFIDENSNRIDVEGVCEGNIGYEPKGENGFGYDPIFMVGEKSFSELSDEEKDQCSHRGKALRELTKRLGQHL